MAPKIAIICPCYNEEEVIEHSADRLWNVLEGLSNNNKIDPESFILFVNDGSVDKSWEIIKGLNARDKKFKGIDLTFNSGHQFALLSGMNFVKDTCDAAITIDVDLQDDITCIEKMIDKFAQGNEVVYGVKNKRDVDGFLKWKTAICFYKLQRLLKIDIVVNHADFRLVSSKVMKVLSLYKESSIYLRGIIPSLGFKSDIVTYDIVERDAGESKYTKSKMLKLASEGILGFSPAPLKGIIWIGFIFLIIALINGIDIVVSLINGSAQPGWSQLMLSIWLVGGFILIAIGLVGMYIGRTYSQVKNRPRYIISDTVE